MAIKAGQILHVANTFVIDRIQSGGVSNLNIPEEKIYELGNYSSVETIRDIPDLSFDIESFDMSTEIEALINHLTPSSVVAGQEIDFAHSLPMDIISPFKSGTGAYDIVKGVAIPYLTLESCTYRFGVRQNSTQQFTFKGDSMYFVPGVPKTISQAITAGTNQTYTFGGNTALQYQEAGNDNYCLSVCLKNVNTGKSKRLFFAHDGTSATGDYYYGATGATLGVKVFADVTADFPAATTGVTIDIVYGTAAATTYGTGVHQGASVKPGAIRGKDIAVTVYTGASTPVAVQWTGVQSIECTRRVNLEADEEMGNPKYVGQDYDVPDVSGNIVVKPLDTADLWAKIHQVAYVTNTANIVGPYSSVPLQVEITIKDPETGAPLKTLYIPDARFTIPAIQGRIQTKQQVTFNFTSDSGTLLVYNGDRP